MAPTRRRAAGVCRKHGVSDLLRNKKEIACKSSNSRPEWGGLLSQSSGSLPVAGSLSLQLYHCRCFQLFRLLPTPFQSMQPGANLRAAAARCPWKKRRDRREGERDRNNNTLAAVENFHLCQLFNLIFILIPKWVYSSSSSQTFPIVCFSNHTRTQPNNNKRKKKNAN